MPRHAMMLVGVLWMFGCDSEKFREEAGLIEVPLGCADVFVDVPVNVPAQWTGETAIESQEDVASPALTLYDNCKPKSFTLENCDLPFGKQFCMNGHWTILCKDDSHCPGSMRCTWGTGVGVLPVDESIGWCAKKCKIPGTPGDCFRSDLYCDSILEVCFPLVREDIRLTEGPCIDGEPGLLIQIDFDAVECNVYDDLVSIDIAGTKITESKPGTHVRNYRIPWPDGVQKGAVGTVDYVAKGEGLEAIGSNRFTVDPKQCVIVRIDAHCQNSFESPIE